MCLHCKDMEITKNIEIRWCDNYADVYEKAMEIRNKYYEEENNENRKVG